MTNSEEIAQNMYDYWISKYAKPYVIAPNDIVWNLIKGKGLTVKDVELANPGKDFSKLHPGDIINLPEGLELEKIRKHIYKPIQKGSFNLNKTIADAAAFYGIDSSILKALIYIESSNNPKADSGAAQGLTQLTPYAQKSVGVADPFDPVQSVHGGAHWLQIALKEARALKGADPKKQLLHALMIYHAGFPEVQKWINAGSPKGGFGGVKSLTLEYPYKILELAGKQIV